MNKSRIIDTINAALNLLINKNERENEIFDDLSSVVDKLELIWKEDLEIITLYRCYNCGHKFIDNGNYDSDICPICKSTDDFSFEEMSREDAEIEIKED